MQQPRQHKRERYYTSMPRVGYFTVFGRMTIGDHRLIVPLLRRHTTTSFDAGTGVAVAVKSMQAMTVSLVGMQPNPLPT